MSNRSMAMWLSVIVFLGILVGVAGGGLMGGVAGYYAAAQRSSQALPAATAQLLAAQVPAQPTVVGTTLTVSEDSAVIDAVKKTWPGVVTIVNTLQSSGGRGSRRFGPSGGAIAEGSGVIIDQQGHIVTNAHVVAGAAQLQVVYADGTTVNAKLIGADTNQDIAVLQVSGKVPAVIPLGNSTSLQLGETVIAIGSPLGSYEGSVTVGVVSGLNRTVQGSGETNLIQTDAAINHGNSGGPLLNLAGQVVGLNTLVIQNSDSGELVQGLGFAIPSSTVSSVVNRILAGNGTP